MNGSEKYFNYIENLIKEEYGYLKKFLNNGDITVYKYKYIYLIIIIILFLLLIIFFNI